MVADLFFPNSLLWVLNASVPWRRVAASISHVSIHLSSAPSAPSAGTPMFPLLLTMSASCLPSCLPFFCLHVLVLVMCLPLPFICDFVFFAVAILGSCCIPPFFLLPPFAPACFILVWYGVGVSLVLLPSIVSDLVGYWLRLFLFSPFV